jgi:peptidoglycan/LPS O-acetylase OafA/YrhL
MFALLLLRISLYDGGLFRWVLRSRVLGGAGLISYALYMYHAAVNATLRGYFFHQRPQITNWSERGVGFLIVVFSVCLATLSYIFLERPIRRLGQRVRFERAATPSPRVALAKILTTLVSRDSELN